MIFFRICFFLMTGCALLDAESLSTNSFGSPSAANGVSFPLPATLEEYDTLSPADQKKVYFKVSTELRDRIIDRGRAVNEAWETAFRQQRFVEIHVRGAGYGPISQVFWHAKDLTEEAIRSKYPDSKSPERAKLLKQNKEKYRRLYRLLGTTTGVEPLIDIWNKYKSALEKISLRYPRSNATFETAKALEDELNPMIAELEKLPRIPDNCLK